MGRMFETLKNAGAVRSNVVEGATVRQDCVVDWSLRESPMSGSEEVPFIEVGDGQKVEGSPQVMAAPVRRPAAVQAPHPATEKALAHASQVPAVALTPAKPMKVSFEVWPGASPGRGVAPEIITYHQPGHAISQQYAALFNKIVESLSGTGAQGLLLCGAKARVGTSTVLLNLGVAGADHGKRRMVLVDAHRTRPTLADRLGITATVGLHDVLAGHAALEQAVLKTSVPGLHLLPARATPQAADLPTCEALAWMLGSLRSRFSMLLLDAPAWETSADASLLAPSCDGVFLVVPRDESDHHNLTQSISRAGGRLRGLIHTQIEG